MIGGNSPISTEEQLSQHLNDSYGLRNLKPEWISQRRASLQSSLTHSICNTDIREISQGSLPWRPQDAHSVRLGIKVLVQIDEVINVATPDPKASTPRLLQFALTDGAVNFIAIETDPRRSSFSTGTVPGTKLVLLPSALVRRGRILLTSADYTLLGAPERATRISGSGEAVPTSAGLIRSRETSGSNISGPSGARSLNPSMGNITNVGGIAAIPHTNDEGEDHDGLWGQDLTTCSRCPVPARGRITDQFSMRMNENSEMQDSVRRSSPGAQELSETGNIHTGRNDRAQITAEPGAGVASTSRVHNNQQTAPPFCREAMSSRNSNVVRDDAEQRVAFQAPQTPIEVPLPPEGEIEIPDSDGEEPTKRLEHLNIMDSRSLQLVRLSHLMERRLSLTAKQGICRLYAMKTGKAMDYYLTRHGINSTVVDDGTSVKVVALSKELADTLRNNRPNENEGYRQALEHDTRRPLRNLCGFVHMKCENNVPVAMSYVSESSVSTDSMQCCQTFWTKSQPNLQSIGHGELILGHHARHEEGICVPCAREVGHRSIAAESPALLGFASRRSNT